MRDSSGRPETPITRKHGASLMDAARSYRVLKIRAIKHDTQIRPRMVMQRTGVVAAHEAMQVDVEYLVSRDEPPAVQVRPIPAADDEIRGTVLRARNNPLCETIHLASFAPPPPPHPLQTHPSPHSHPAPGGR